MSLPYNKSTGRGRSYQVWNSDGYNFYRDNAILLTSFLNIADWGSLTGVRFHRNLDGTARIIGDLTYVPFGPTFGAVTLITIPTDTGIILSEYDVLSRQVMTVQKAVPAVNVGWIAMDTSANSLIYTPESGASALSSSDLIPLNIELLVPPAQ